MKYYDVYEAVYRQIRSSEKPTWDAFFDERASFEQFWTRPFIDHALDQVSFATANPSALELGCGAGQACCYLARKGFNVTGIDVSTTAVAMARQQAGERGLAVRYECGNVTALPERTGPFDLILDGNCLHCVVFDHERANVYRSIREVLAPRGYVLVNTMVWREDIEYAWPLLRDADGVLWMDGAQIRSLMPGARLECDERRRIGASDYLPYRCVSTPEQLRRELSRNGFRIAWERIEPPRQSGVEPMFQAILVDDDAPS
jgi:2-polyprenyl-3-methyl-5-hydroxy-6-metoxy-1,4-benzoquinol methylase